MTELRLEPLTLPGVRLGPENPLPIFRDAQPHRTVPVHDSVPLPKRDRFGWETGFRVLPYRLQDNYTRQREPLTLQSIVLENDRLCATFLPELGGRLISLIHKTEQRELLCRNPVFQPANLALRNAWFSGGIEWNIGQFGHAFSTCAPLFAAAITGEQGEPGLRLYEFERCKGLFWQIDFYLPPASPWLIAYTRVVNPGADDVPMYWWTNIAVPEAPDVRVLAPAREAIYIDFALGELGFGCGHLPHLPTLNGGDATYSLNFPFANEFFFQCDEADLPWEAALDGQGSGLIEASTPRLRHRKLWCWGNHLGGRHWQDFLSPGGQPYIEIQAGLAPTQLHGQVMPARTQWDWTQVFGYLKADPARVHAAHWNTAWQTVDAALKAQLSLAQLNDIEARCRQRADLAASAILMTGAGWGALELKRRASRPGSTPLPPAFIFPDSTLGSEQIKWLTLLQEGHLPTQSPDALPGEWLVQTEWRAILAQSLQGAAAPDWYAWLHLGVMALENFDEVGAEAAWRASIQLQPSAWAYRNLAVLAQRQGRPAAALEFYEQAWAMAAPAAQHALAQEYLAALCQVKDYARALAAYRLLPAAVQNTDRLQMARGQIALGLGDFDMVEQVLQREYAVVREGETVLTDLWFELWQRRLAAQSGQPVTEALRQRVDREYPPPARIDFRLFS